MSPDANETQTPPASPRLWRGLEEYMETPAFREAMENEFPEDAAEWLDPVSRRNFLTIMGASLALAGAAGCSPRPAPMRKIVPYTRQPEEITPGVPLFFATAFPMAGYITGVLARSHEGRPVKIEGNPSHPSSLGGTSLFEQASILDLYDPDRSKTPTRFGVTTAYETVEMAIRRQLYEQNGQPKTAVRLRILTGAVTSPSLARSITGLLAQFPEARWVQFEPCGQQTAREGSRKAFGKDVTVTYDFTKADVILSLDADFLGTGPGQVRYNHDFGTRRRVRQSIPATQENAYVKPEQMNRLYVVECMPSITGSVADHRLPVLSSQVDVFARALAAKLGVAGAAPAGNLPEAAQKWLDAVANDLQTHKGRCVVIAGDHQPPHVHALAHAMNAHLGNIGEGAAKDAPKKDGDPKKSDGGRPVIVRAPVEVRPADKVIDLATLVKEMGAKAVDALLIFEAPNPGYTAPADLDFAGTIKNVPLRVHLGNHQDETAGLCEWHINEAHYLETWGDGRGFDGTAAIQQPLIAPLYDGRSAIEVIAGFTKSPVSEGREIVRDTWREQLGQSGEFEAVWQEVVRSGVVPGTESPPEAGAKLAGNWAEGIPAPQPAPAADELEINFRADPTLFDGRFANNGWLQELPKPVTKLSWDNAVFVSPKKAKELGVHKEFEWTGGERGRADVSVMVLDYKGRQIKLPVWPLPGHPDDAVTVHLGHGRERAGRVGNPESDQTASGRVPGVGLWPGSMRNAEGKLVHGTNAYAIRTSDAPYFGNGLKLTRTRDTYFIANIQGYWVMTQVDPLDGHIIHRDPVRRGTIEEYKANPWFGKIPPTAAAETDAINHNVPGPASKPDPASGTQGRQGLTYGPALDHDHDHGSEGGHDHAHENGHAHDKRLLPLTMYHPNDELYPSAAGARRWGMAIDLSACTGCSACVVACQSENNIPVVGKQEITRGHDMYWIRIDRYYEGTYDDPNANKTFFQPVPCQQCEKAPCEVVCPVAATVHSADGLNDMVYNRCVGTRYCSNNCPYKVRRFNFLTFQDWATPSLKLGRNPDVSVRSRGVMEKCTYCVQRIRYAEIVAEREHRPIRDGEVRTACQSACPSGAIVFGDLNDPNSTVGKWKGEPANYGLLAELNTMPRTSYLSALRNPNPEMPGQG